MAPKNKQGVLILGASGTGTTTLGRLLGETPDYFFSDSDHYYWEPTNPPFEKPRSRDERIQLLEELVHTRSKFIVSGSICGWGDILIPHLKTVLFLEAPTELRIERIIQREELRYSKENIMTGSIHHEKLQAFLDWSRAYETGDVSRTRKLHETWLNNLEVSVYRINTNRTIMEVHSEALRILSI